MKALKVLVVDDDMINRKLMAAMLKKSPMIGELVEASDGQEAITLLRDLNDIDLVLLDIIMPIMDGIAVLQIMNSDPALQNIPVIVLTTDETKKTEALNSGANDFIAKPVREHEIMGKIERLSTL
ncbi:chemotaxis response regulator protein-glutamate methylesterase CheB [Hydrogenimonas sp.]|nr:chemotaxis response regulator protein-glutamate methylesterase CheB [Hydrogenimonas sp.]